MVDESGSVIVLKNNVPRYLIIDFSKASEERLAADEDVSVISRRLIAKNKAAYKELAANDQAQHDTGHHLHDELIRETGGRLGLRDESMLDAALNAPFHSFSGADAYPSIQHKAARLGFSLIQNHPFIDGKQAYWSPCHACFS